MSDKARAIAQVVVTIVMTAVYCLGYFINVKQTTHSQLEIPYWKKNRSLSLIGSKADLLTDLTESNMKNCLLNFILLNKLSQY